MEINGGAVRMQFLIRSTVSGLMYRGCTHSRKHVEASQIVNVLDTNSPKDSENLKAISVHSPQLLLPLPLKLSCDSKN